MEGRDNGSPGAERAAAYLVSRLEEFAEPLGDDFRAEFADGTNLLGVIRGQELPDEYLVLGAHYDHLGRDCPSSRPGDDICNGATDNAAGVAAVLEIGRRLADAQPRRSVVIALWDAEEDDLLGARAYVADPPVPLADTIAYLNWDILGANLLPSLASTTVMVGAETEGRALVDAAAEAAEASELDPMALSLLFGQGRSDHAVFAEAGIPTVFATDSNTGCYHTAQDDLLAVDIRKLGRQIDLGEALARELTHTDTPPTFAPDTPAATFDDARSLLEVVERTEPDLDLLPTGARSTITRYRDDLRAIVAAGAGSFDDAAVATLLGGSVELVRILTEVDCDSFVR